MENAKKRLLIGPNVVMSSKNAVTIGSLIEKDLKEAYFLPQKPSSYCKGYRFLNDKEYQVFDYPPCPLKFRRFVSPFRHLPAAGNEIPIIMECKPESYLQQHWKQWLPAFPPVVIKSLDEGLVDEIPVVTTAALQGIPKHKHSVHPDVLYEVQLKSSILNIDVPSPRHLGKDAISYPCMVKVDMNSGGLGNCLVKNEDELSITLRQIRDVCHWQGEIVFQEFIPGVKEVPSFQFYLHKSGEIFWVGTTTGGFNENLPGRLEQWTGRDKRSMNTLCTKSSLYLLRNIFKSEATLAWSLLRFLSQTTESTWLMLTQELVATPHIYYWLVTWLWILV